MTSRFIAVVGLTGVVAWSIVAVPAAQTQSPLADAAMRRDAAAVTALLRQGSDVNAAAR